MTRRASPRLLAYVMFAAVALVVGLATGRTDLVVYACPFVVFVLVGLATTDDRSVAVAVGVAPERSIEGEPVDVVVQVDRREVSGRVDMALRLPSGTRSRGGPPVYVLRAASGGVRELTTSVVADRWGAFALGALAVRVHDPLSLFVHEHDVPAAATARFYPPPEHLRRLARPRRTQLIAGDRVANKAVGEGIELADLRPFMPGDRPRDVNWRASARRGQLWVTQRHPERSTDVVVFVDMFSDDMLLPAVRSAATLVDAYLRSRDRVGLVGFGGVVQWARAGQGVRQLYRLLDTLVDSRTFFSYAWKDVGVIPPRVLMPGSLVIGLSPLEDERATSALVDLRGRGFEVAIIELTAPDPQGSRRSTEVDDLARRLWRLQREHQREQLRQFGISVAEWRVGDPLSLAMEELWNASETTGARRHG